MLNFSCDIAPRCACFFAVGRGLRTCLIWALVFMQMPLFSQDITGVTWASGTSQSYAYPGLLNVANSTAASGSNLVFSASEMIILKAGFTASAGSQVQVKMIPDYKPIALFTAASNELAVNFDASASYDPEGHPLTYEWTFGDGSSGGSVVKPSHAYAAPGTYTVVLWVTDYGTNRSGFSASVTVRRAPVPNFTIRVDGNTIYFDASSTTNPNGTSIAYGWNFGDGSSGSGVAPAHAYTTGGTFLVTLTVNDSYYNRTIAKSVATGPNQLPIANFSYTKTTYKVNFDASSSSDPDGTLVDYAWTFGDGSTGSGKNIEHLYNGSGPFTVKLSVTDNKGGVGDKSQSISIDPMSVVYYGQYNSTNSMGTNYPTSGNGIKLGHGTIQNPGLANAVFTPDPNGPSEDVYMGQYFTASNVYRIGIATDSQYASGQVLPLGRGWISGSLGGLNFRPDTSVASQNMYYREFVFNSTVKGNRISYTRGAKQGVSFSKGWLSGSELGWSTIPDKNVAPNDIYASIYELSSVAKTNPAFSLETSQMAGSGSVPIGNGYITGLSNGASIFETTQNTTYYLGRYVMDSSTIQWLQSVTIPNQTTFGSYITLGYGKLSGGIGSQVFAPDMSKAPYTVYEANYGTTNNFTHGFSVKSASPVDAVKGKGFVSASGYVTQYIPSGSN